MRIGVALLVVQSRKCTAEAQALREARRVFGKTRFDRADTDFPRLQPKRSSVRRTANDPADDH